jgi:hypothetical protein
MEAPRVQDVVDSNADLLWALGSSELRSIYRLYASMGNSAEPWEQPSSYGVALPAWVEFVSDIHVTHLAEPEEVFAASCGLLDPLSAHLDELQFLGALVRLAHTVAAGDTDLHDPSQLLDRLRRLLDDCVFPFARRNSASGLNKVIGVRPELMPFLEECRLSFTGCGVTWERWLALWNEMVFMQIPGYPDWESEVFRTVSKHFAQLLRIFSHHAKQTWLRSFGEAKALEIREHVLALDTSEWIHFLADCRLNPSKAHEDCDCHSEDDAEESR